MARTLYQGLRGRKPVTILLGALSADFTADTVGVRRSVEIVDCLERQVANAFLSRIESRDVLYDIGAECGVYGILAAKRCQKVVCFEPFPDSYSNVLGNITLNHLTNCDVCQVAIGNKRGVLRMSNSTNGQIHCPRMDPSGHIEVPVMPLDEIVNSLPIPSVLKIDVEGLERQVFEGSLSLLPTVRLVLVELHPHIPNEDHEWIKELLRSHGFMLQVFTSRPPAVHVLAAKT